MNAELLNREQIKEETRDMLRSAQVSPKLMVAIYLGLNTVLSLVVSLLDGGSAEVLQGSSSPAGLFALVLCHLISAVLSVGFLCYCLAICRGERAELMTLFDGFSFAGKCIALYITQYVLVLLWSTLFLFPGIVASYRYRFAMYDLCQDPELGVFQALNMSKVQTRGYKMQLFSLDLSFVGWLFLSALPTVARMFCLSSGAAFPVEGLAFVLLANLWQLAVSLFFLPVLQCAEVRYYEAACRTSGVEPGQA